jgi:hypothetical protein
MFIRIALSITLCLLSLNSFSQGFPSFQCTNPPYDQVKDANGNIYGHSTNTCECCANNNYNPTGCTNQVRQACTTGAPINGGLVFLLISGVGLGAWTLHKEKAKISA